jgi:5-methyltetrahydrofolate--homocysteine methyltransferase
MIIIGEKINGSIPSMAKSIAAHDVAHIKDLAKKESEAGASFIDVCASVPEAQESETLKWMLEAVQEATDTPIRIDSPSVASISKVLPLIKKPGLINSVSMEGNKVDTIFPLIAGTDWQCICLLSDDTGIPKSSEDRLRVFDKLMKKAEEYKIPPERLHIDPLIEMLCTSEDGIKKVTDTIIEVKKRYPAIHVTGGASNISFNLPARKYINRAFIILAMNAGMDSAILDPLNADMMGLLYATEAMLGHDDFCMDYITAYREGRFGPVK